MPTRSPHHLQHPAKSAATRIKADSDETAIGPDVLPRDPAGVRARQ